jgi:hypothetical protein
MSKNYVRIWEEYNGQKLPEGKEIHHIDGNHDNNDPNNLLVVTIEQHLEIHQKQKDYGAVQAILMRMNRSESDTKMLIECASKHQKKLLSEGRHNFQLMTEERRKEISSKVGNYTKENGIGLHKINADPVLSKQNASKAGLSAKQKKAGFHDPLKSGSNYVRNTFWWTNSITGERKRSQNCPGNNWNKGMK